MIIPNRHDEDHTSLQGVTHGFDTTLSGVLIIVTEEFLLSDTVVIGQGVVVGEGIKSGFGVLNNITILNVESLDLYEVTSGGIIASNELSYYGELLGGIDFEARSDTEEILDTHSVWVEITTISIADAGPSVLFSALVVVTLEASVLTSDLGFVTRVRGIGRSHGVSLPDVHFGATGTILSSSRVWIRWR